MKDKVVIRFNGGLGNQMFQWAFGRMLEETTNADISFDMSYFTKRYARPYQLDIFNIKPKFVSDFFTKLKFKMIWTFRKNLKNKKFLGTIFWSENQFNFNPCIDQINCNTYVEGFFQSEKYFKSVEEIIRAELKFTAPISNESKAVADEISGANSISLHIRRGDYVQKKRHQDAYATCSLDYYARGVEYIAQKHPEPVLFIFSDDIEWVKQNLKLPYKMVFVTHNTGKASYEDMWLMSLCSNNIIANSSFSWWGAWLNNNKEKIVIAPEKWFNDDNIIQTDVIPSSWIRLDN